jgi:hypothetical protein
LVQFQNTLPEREVKADHSVVQDPADALEADPADAQEVDPAADLNTSDRRLVTDRR